MIRHSSPSSLSKLFARAQRRSRSARDRAGYLALFMAFLPLQERSNLDMKSPQLFNGVQRSEHDEYPSERRHLLLPGQPGADQFGNRFRRPKGASLLQQIKGRSPLHLIVAFADPRRIEALRLLQCLLGVVVDVYGTIGIECNVPLVVRNSPPELLARRLDPLHPLYKRLARFCDGWFAALGRGGGGQ